MSALLNAIAESDICAVERMLNAGVGVNARDDSGRLPLVESIRSGGREMSDLLIRHGANPNLRDAVGRTPLQCAAFAGRAALLDLLIEGRADVDAPSQSEGTALYWAVCGGHLEIVERLLAAGCDVNLATEEGRTPLDRSASALYSPAALTIAGELIRHGADVNCRNHHGVTPLMWAASGGRTDIVRLLLGAGADVSAVANNGQSVLLFACGAKMNGGDLVRLLLDEGADLDAVDQYGAGALNGAAAEGSCGAIRELIAAGLDPNERRNERESPLVVAAREGRLSVVRVLLEHGAEADGAATGAESGPLIECLRRHYDDVARTLIEAGADVNRRGLERATPLLCALGYFDWFEYERSRPPRANLELIELLLDRGADPGGESEHGQTPLGLARAKRNTRLIGLIKRRMT